MSSPSRETKQLICNRKSIKTAKPAKRENVRTAGMWDRAPAHRERERRKPEKGKKRERREKVKLITVM